MAAQVDALQALHAQPLVVVHGMAVLVQGDGGIGVPQKPGQRHNIHPLFQGPGGKGMSQAMEVGVGDPRLPDAPLEQVLVG